MLGLPSNDSRENLFNSAIFAHFNFVSASISCIRRYPRVITMDSESDTEGYHSSDGQSDFEDLETSVNVEASAAREYQYRRRC